MPSLGEKYQDLKAAIGPDGIENTIRLKMESVSIAGSTGAPTPAMLRIEAIKQLWDEYISKNK